MIKMRSIVLHFNDLAHIAYKKHTHLLIRIQSSGGSPSVRYSADMNYLIVLLLGAACIQENSSLGCFGKPWARTALKAKYSPLIFNGFYDLPKSTDSNLIDDEKFVEIDAETAQLSIPGSLFCHDNDARVCVIFDNNGTVVGARTSFLVNDVRNVEGYDFAAVNTYKKTNMFNQPAWSMDVMYFDPATITEDGVGGKSEVAEGLWVTVQGQTVHLPATDPKVENYNGFQRQACFPQMGQHYFYGVNTTQTDCTQQVPFFGIYHNGGLVGYGIANYGKPSSAENGRDWYESVPLLGAKLIMPNRPQCVDDLINQNGLYSLHVYFVEQPALIGCLFQ